MGNHVNANPGTAPLPDPSSWLSSPHVRHRPHAVHLAGERGLYAGPCERAPRLPPRACDPQALAFGLTVGVDGKVAALGAPLPLTGAPPLDPPDLVPPPRRAQVRYAAAAAARSAHSLPDLACEHGALEPSISATIMEIHHSKHHQTYVNGLNAAEESLTAAVAANDVSKYIELHSAIK